MGTLRDLQFALQLKIEELRQRDTLIDELELELDTKDELIRRLQEELDRYRATVSLPGPSAAACSAQGEDNQRAKKKTVISEPFTLDPVTLAMVFHRSCDKNQESQRLIHAAFLKNDLLKSLDEGEINAIIDCMYSTTIHQGCDVIQEGTNGGQAYVLEALTDSKLWVIDRKSYQTILMQTGLHSLSHSVELLSSVPCLQSLPEDVIMKMCDLLEEMNYTEGDYIIRQGAMGDTFYIISKGQVKVTEKKPDHEEQIVLSKLSERQWFGEKALWGEDVRTVNVIATGEVTCLLIDRETFKNIIGGLVFDSSHKVLQNTESKVESDEDHALLSSSTLSDFQIICTLGVGEFGHVDLVQLKNNIKCLFAMRVLEKKLILNSGQREHILRERRILMEAHCPFIVRLHKTFRDEECLYMLTEACLRGGLYSLLRDKGCLDECSTRFYTACVVEALTFLHCQGVVYRDIKPENVVLDEHGYAKLIGSRCAKKVEVGKKTWTFCGTPGYMAPEIILNKGHNISADLFSLGVFVFELLTGKSNPTERLGSQRNGAKDIQKHKWFEGFNWDGLCKGMLIPPLIPKVKHLLDGTCSHYTGDSAEMCTDWNDF
ncbi:hypothetical protein PAMP_022509 [Pampus punctatissimus]